MFLKWSKDCNCVCLPHMSLLGIASILSQPMDHYVGQWKRQRGVYYLPFQLLTKQ